MKTASPPPGEPTPEEINGSAPSAVLAAKLEAPTENAESRTAPAPGHRINRPTTATAQPPVRPPLTGAGVTAVVLLGFVLVGIIGVAFRGSWTAHRDAALAAHFDATGATLYPFAPDGLIVIALIAALVLRHEVKARFYALSVVGVFTVTSFVVNHLHGLGQFARVPLTGALPSLPWPVVGLIAGQLIGAMFFGSHLIVYALRYLFPSTQLEQAGQAAVSAETPVSTNAPSAGRPAPEQVVKTVLVPADPDPEDVAKLVYGIALDLGTTVGRDKLAKACGISARTSARIRADVETDRDEQAKTEAAEKEAAEAAEALKTTHPVIEQDAVLVASAPSLNGSTPSS